MAKLDSLKISLQLEIKNQEKLKELQKAFKDLEKSGGTAGFDKLKQSLKDGYRLKSCTYNTSVSDFEEIRNGHLHTFHKSLRLGSWNIQEITEEKIIVLQIFFYRGV